MMRCKCVCVRKCLLMLRLNNDVLNATETSIQLPVKLLAVKIFSYALVLFRANFNSTSGVFVKKELFFLKEIDLKNVEKLK